ncbi:YncE family protein [Streptomyces sp. NPDC058171]
MRTRSISSATALAVLFSSAVLVAGTAGSAAADSARVLNVKSVGDVVVDDARQRVFVSDPRSGKIVVTDYAGRVVKTLSGLPGVHGLERSAAGQVYAAVGDTGRIVSVDTGTLSQTASYDLGAERPHDLAVAGGKLWFSHAAGLGSLDVSAAEPVVVLAAATGSQPLLGADPAAPDVLVTATDRAATVYDVSTGTAVERTRGGIDAENLREVDVTPDGRRFVVASGAPYEHVAYSTTDLSRATSYRTTHYPNAVAIAPDGTVAAGVDGSYSPDVYVFPKGHTKLVRSYEFPNTGHSSGSDLLLPGGLAWTSDSRRLFALSTNSLGTVSLRTFDNPTRSLPKVTVSAPSSATRAKQLTVTGKVSATLALPAGTPLTVTRTDTESPSGKRLASVKTTSSGSFSFKDTPPSGGKVTYRVAYAGSSTHAAAAGSDSVSVSRAATTLKLDKNKNVYAHGTSVKFTATLGKTYKNRTVKLYSDPAGDGRGRVLVKTGKVASNGKISATVKLGRDTTVTAVYDGDSRTSGKSAKSWVGSKVRISTKLTNHYKTARLNGATTHYYKASKDPYVKTAMTAYPGRQHRLQLQVRVQGRWQELGTEYFPTGSYGESSVRLLGPHELGYQFRVRASYINGAHGDNVHSTTHGAWKYLIHTR